MKEVRVHRYHQRPVVEEVLEPRITLPQDVIVEIGGAGLALFTGYGSGSTSVEQ